MYTTINLEIMAQSNPGMPIIFFQVRFVSVFTFNFKTKTKAAQQRESLHNQITGRKEQ